MDQIPEEEQRRARELYAAIGECIVAWAQVETSLAYLWRLLTGAKAEASDLIWGRVRSFDAKIQLVSDLIASTEPEAQRTDWGLLKSYTMAQYARRNQVAHATMTIDESYNVLLEPFMSLSRPSGKFLTAKDIDAFTVDFSELAAAISVFEFSVRASQPQEWPGPVPDLMQRLRTRDVQRREAQRHRALAWRQYLQNNPDLKLD